MRSLLSDQVTYLSDHPPEEVLRRLQEAVGPRRNLRLYGPWPKPHPPFEGKVDAQGFDISRIIHYRNSFLPEIKGQFLPAPNGRTRIEVRLQLDTAVSIFLVFWTGLLLVFFFFSLLQPDADDPWLFLFPIGMIAFACILTMISFSRESRRARKELAKVLDARVENTDASGPVERY